MSNILEGFQDTTHIFFTVFIIIFSVIFVASFVIIIISIIKHVKAQSIVNNVIKTRINEVSNFENEILAASKNQPENDVKNDTKKVIKIKCSYCGSKYTSDKDKCPSCGAKNNQE